jgi:hypothetical protein
VASNATFDASSSQEWGLRSNSDEATLATLPGITRAKRNGIGGHRYHGTRTHSAGLSHSGAKDRPPPPSGPEKAWRWIVRSATSVLAALSPPPSR